MGKNIQTKLKKRQAKPNVTVAKKQDSPIQWLVFCSFLLIGLHLLLVFVTSKLPSDADKYNALTRIWGFDLISYFSPMFIALAYLVAIAVCIPFINKKITDWVLSMQHSDSISKLRKFKYLLFLIVSVIAVWVFYSFKIKYHFLGDMDIRVNQTMKGEFLDTEYWIMFLLNKVYTFLHAHYGLTGLQTFVIQSVAAGGIFVFVSCLIADLIGSDIYEKIVVFLFSVFIGTLLFYFGYVEIYSLPGLSVTLYVYGMLLWIKNKTYFIVPLLLLILAMMFYLMAVGLIPSFIIMLYKKHGFRLPVFNNIKTKPFIILLLIGLPISYLLARTYVGYFAMTIETHPKYPQVMTLFSFKHLWEYFNSQILASGVGFFVFVYFSYKAIRKKIKFDDTMWFLLSASFFMFYISFIANTVRGSGDWDIHAFPALIYNLLVIYYLVSIRKIPEKRIKVQYAISVLLTFNILHTICWAGINASDKSIKKIGNMLETDPGYYYVTKLSGLANLAMSYRANGLKDISLEYYKKMYVKNYTDLSTHFYYANELLNNNKKVEAIAVYENVIKTAPYAAQAYPPVLSYYEENKRMEEEYRMIDWLYTNFTKNPQQYAKNFPKEQLKNYFTYLYQIESNRKNIAKANAISSVLVTLK